MRRFVGFIVGLLAALAALTGPGWACNSSHHDTDWACVYDTNVDVGYCQQNPLPDLDAPEDAEVLPEVPDLAPIVEDYVAPAVPGKRL
jgi:hypothetical protein